jgi:hypothetical protein
VGSGSNTEGGAGQRALLTTEPGALEERGGYDCIVNMLVLHKLSTGCLHNNNWGWRREGALGC